MVLITEGYDVSYKVTNDWGSGFNGEITVNNLTDQPIQAWSLSFTGNLTIDDLWNAKLVSKENGKFVINNSESNMQIAAKSSVTFNFRGTKTEKLLLKDFALSEMIIDDSFTSGEETELALFAAGFYDEEAKTIELQWQSTAEGGSFDVMSSFNGTNFECISKITALNSYSYNAADHTEELYFKIVQYLNGKSAESNIICMKYTEDGYSMHFEDRDSDGLPDIYEEELGTDPLKPDTDGDKLTDYQEVYLTGTDPLKADTDGDGISDAKEDDDEDGLSAIDEIALETDPSNSDTDNDGLNDGNEINKYTDPLRYDTDEDGISDGDEIKLGLNPLKASTNGVPDNQYTIEQTVSSDNEALADINTEENSYELSVDIKAAGNVEGSLTAKESSYSSVIKNDAVLGTCAELIYNNDCKIDDVVLKFKVDDAYISNEGSEYAAVNSEFAGIKRYNIFRYFDDVNMLLPIETKFDASNNLLYADVDQLGTYCVMDMEKWLKSLEIEPDEENISTDETDAEETESLSDEVSGETDYSTQKVQSDFLGKNNALTANITENKDNINVVFMIDNRNITDEASFNTIKDNIYEVSKIVLNESKNASIYLLLNHYDKEERSFLGFTALSSGDGKIANNNIEEIKKLLDGLKTQPVDQFSNYCILSDSVKYVLENCTNKDKTYCFSIFNQDKVVYRAENGYDVLSQLAENNIDVSIISPIDADKNIGYAIDLYTKTGGIYVDRYEGFSDEALIHIYGEVPEIPEVKYNMILATGLKKVVLEAELNSANGADTDKDSLTDWNEVDTESGLISWDENGDIVLPTFAQCVRKKGETLFYVEKGLERYTGMMNILNNIKVLPIVSDPTSEDGDGDGDGLLDGKAQEYNDKKVAPKDPDPLKANGPIGIWQEHVHQIETGTVPTELEKWYGDTNPNTINTGVEGFSAFWEEFDKLEQEGEIKFSTQSKFKIATWIVICASSGANLSNINNMNENNPNIILSKVAFKMAMSEIEKCIVKEENTNYILTSLGARILNFKADKNGNLHSQFLMWQAVGGYNNAYDAIFRTYTNENMRREKFPFTIDKTEYILWIWRGDYLNLGAGAEIGIYSRPTWLSGAVAGLDHYFVDFSLAMPMTLNLYNYNGEKDIDCIYNWAPDNNQWWITGFNPECVGNVDVTKQVMIGTVDFSGNEEMYDAFVNEMGLLGNESKRKYLIFDETNQTVWFCWCEGSSLR